MFVIKTQRLPQKYLYRFRCMSSQFDALFLLDLFIHANFLFFSKSMISAKQTSVWFQVEEQIYFIDDLPALVLIFGSWREPFGIL